MKGIMMKKIKVLVIAPYAGLIDTVQSVAKDFPEIIVDIVDGNMAGGVEVVRKKQNEGYDAIISRGGTTTLVSKAVVIPVIDIEFSAYDIIRIIRTVNSVSNRVAIVGFPEIAESASTVNELLNQNIYVKTINKEEDMESCLIRLRDKGYNLIVGDVIAHTTAQRLNINSVLLASGRESLYKAFKEVLMLHRFQKLTLAHLNIVQEIMNLSSKFIYINDSSGKLLYRNYTDNDNDLIEIKKQIDKFDSDIIQNGKHSACLIQNGYIWNIRGIRITQDDTVLIVYFLDKKCYEDDSYKQAIQIKDVNTIGEGVNYALYGESEKFKNLNETVRLYGEILLPVLIIGETGTGRESIAYFMHKESAKSMQPLIKIDCEKLNGEQYKAEFSSQYNYLFNKNGGTLFLKNIDLLPVETQNDLLIYLNSYSIKQNFRIIASATNDIGILAENGLFNKNLAKIICEIKLCLSPLRERRETIEGLVSLFIHECNIKFGKQVIGVVSKGIEKIKDFEWPNNMIQLKRVVSELVIGTKGSYINLAQVENALNNEIHSTGIQVNKLDLSKTLNEITKNVVKSVLSDENMNQTRAAKRLGISRSTLWRLIKE
jgi:transcriptional regulator with PAS, ATPase and Fis domain